MKKVHSLCLYALLLAGCITRISAQTAPVVPTTVYKVGDNSTLSASWFNLGQTTNYFVKGDTVVFNAYLTYFSVLKEMQTWSGYTAFSSTQETYNAMPPFVASADWGNSTTSSASNVQTRCATTTTTTKYWYNITNCSAIWVYGNANASTYSVKADVYELDGELNVASDSVLVKTGSITTKAAQIIRLEDLDPSKQYRLEVQGTSPNNSRYYQVAFIAPKKASDDDATLSSIALNGAKLAEFAPEQLAYSVTLPFGTAQVTLDATPFHEAAGITINGKATTTITFTDFPATANIHVVSKDLSMSKDYIVNIAVAGQVSSDATLKDLTVGGITIADFASDKLEYTLQIAYSASLPVIGYTLSDEAASATMTEPSLAAGECGDALIEVVAQDGITRLTYVIHITRAKAIKHLTVVPFTNFAKGAVNESKRTITVPYLLGEDVPVVIEESIQVSGDGTPLVIFNENGTIGLKGIDGQEDTYTVVAKPLEPDTISDAAITFVGNEAYIYAPYGFDGQKGWKFAKKVNQEDNMRDAKGNTRIYMALPPAENVKLTSGSGGAREVVIYVNGVQTAITKLASSGSSITLDLNMATNNFIAIESNQTKGDGGFTKMQLTNPSDPIGSSVVQTSVVAEAVKVLRDGQLLIIRYGKTYTAQGVEVE